MTTDITVVDGIFPLYFSYHGRMDRRFVGLVRKHEIIFVHGEGGRGGGLCFYYLSVLCVYFCLLLRSYLFYLYFFPVLSSQCHSSGLGTLVETFCCLVSAVGGTPQLLIAECTWCQRNGM